MNKMLLMLLLLPFSANATLVFVEFDGTVERSDNPDYAVGDDYSQTFTIDTALAPPDLGADDPHASFFGFPNCSCPADFVFGSLDTAGLRGDDAVSVVNRETGVDLYQFFNRQGVGTPNFSYFQLIMTGERLLKGDGLVQSIEVTAPGESVGFAAWFVDAKYRVVSFTTNRFSITPTPGQFACRR